MGEEKARTCNVAIAGYGGQGVLTIGLLIARAGLKEFNHVSWFPTYETWQRGGRVFCGVVLSDNQVISPIISEPESLIILDEAALDIYEDSLISGGLLVYNSSMVNRELKRDDLKAVSLPATELAKEMGAVQVSNLVLLGSYLKITDVLPIDTIESTLEDTLIKEKKEKLIPLNKEALRCGFEKM
ncbi:MAG: 2-oxoacid:acceptor oxidoreductase family protein [Thermodesulfobacteriota bacterium]|nr:2-oxoacid:acceptor oxidoreductase family protein [Thermodesulfobacteriota bacterium]